MAGWGAFLQKYCKRKIPEEFRKAFRKDFSLEWIRKIPEGLRKDSPEGFSSRSMFLFVFLVLVLVLVFVVVVPYYYSPSCSVFVVLLLFFMLFRDEKPFPWEVSLRRPSPHRILQFLYVREVTASETS